MNILRYNVGLIPIGPASLGLLFFFAISGDVASAQSPQLHLIKNEEPLTYTPSTNAPSASAPQTASKALVVGTSQQTPDAGEAVLLPAGTTTTSTTGTTSFPAMVTVSGRKVQLRPNPAGIYPRLIVPANATIGIHLNVSANMVVQAIVLDGGSVVKKTHISSHKADSNGNIDFTYNAPAGAGRHRVVIVENGQKQTFSFWIGADLPMKIATQNK
jgi:hypothetical protein